MSRLTGHLTEIKVKIKASEIAPKIKKIRKELDKCKLDRKKWITDKKIGGTPDKDFFLYKDLNTGKIALHDVISGEQYIVKDLSHGKKLVSMIRDYVGIMRAAQQIDWEKTKDSFDKKFTESKDIDPTMKLSVALLLTDGDVFLAVRPTMKSYYDIPKGVKDEFESNLQTVIREVKEEVGIDISHYKSKMKPVGRFNYLFDKDLFVFMLRLENLPKTSIMKCDSTFNYKGRQVPEVVGFKYVSFDDLSNFKPPMAKIIAAVRRFME